MLKIGALVSGSGSNLQAIIDNIENGSINGKIVSVVSSNANAYALTRAKDHCIDSIVIKKSHFANLDDYDVAIASHFQGYNVDLVVMAGFMVVLGKHFIDAFYNRIMNIHPSLIPSFCGRGCYGLAVHEQALSKGVKVTGATVHFVDYGTDTGPIILQKAVCVLDDDTPKVLQERVMREAEWIIYPEAVRLFCENKLVIIDNKVFKECC